MTFDPRGICRSRADDPAAQITPETIAEDVHAVLAEVTDEPAYVLGSSGGAIGALAHEPPLTSLLPDADDIRSPTRVVVGAGRTSAGQLAHRTAVALAEALGTQLVLFSGGHGGFASAPEAFATELRKVLAG